MTSAAAVSARLRRLGFRPMGGSASRNREGIRVSPNIFGGVSIAVDLDRPLEGARLADDVEDALRSDGVEVERVDEHHLRVDS